MKVNVCELEYIEKAFGKDRIVSYKGKECDYLKENVYRYKRDGEVFDIVLKGTSFTGLSAKIYKVDLTQENLNYDDLDSILDFVLIKSIRWYEYLMCIIFVIYPIIFGFIGGIMGGLMAVINMILIRQTRNIVIKVLISVLVAGVAFGFVLIGNYLLSLINR